MRKRTRRIVAGALAAVLAVGLTACSNAAEQEKESAASGSTDAVSGQRYCSG